jgi:lysyl-tRNA synthetase class 2
MDKAETVCARPLLKKRPALEGLVSSRPMSEEAAQPLSIHHLEAQRRANRDAAKALGFAPYGERVDGLLSLAQARAKHSQTADDAHTTAGKTPPADYVDNRARVAVGGRVVLRRPGGKLIWMNIRDASGDIQLAVSAKDVPESAFKLAEVLDLGDVVTATGRVMKTKSGEVTVWCDGFSLASKCLAPPPEKHAGLTDVEARYRQRYVDMWATPETMGVFQLRSRIVARIRRYMDERAYLEVETPMLQVLAGGAAARPFVTHMNALDISLFMRIAPELYLKRLLVGGMPRVYEINRNFRNEGLDKQHNPEFTMLEAYHAFGDVDTVMNLTEGLVRDAATMVAIDRRDAGANPEGDDTLPSGGELKLPFGELMIDYGAPFLRAPYPELFERSMGFKHTVTDRVIAEANKRGLKTQGVDPILVVNELFEEYAEKTVDPSRPMFITDYPSAISPLTRPKVSDPTLADRADLFIGGMEIAPHYTELNDPDVQAAKFREQLAGGDAEKAAEERTFRTYDEDFINALKVGMPPAGGMGLGIDRLVMLLTNQRTIRDVVLFPLMRPH